MTAEGVRSCHDRQAQENKAAKGTGKGSSQARDYCVDAGVGGRRSFVAGGGGDGRGVALEPSAQTQDLFTRGRGSGRVVQVQRTGLPDADQSDIEKSDDRGEEACGGGIGVLNSSTQAKAGLEWATRSEVLE